MIIKLILARTNYDAITAWTDIKTVEVNLPLVAQEGWNVIGADWEHDIIHSKQQQERIEAHRLIDALEQEIDQLTGKSRLQRREVSEGVNIKQAENLSEVEKRAIDQLIMDIQENEWYCLQGGSESQMEDWEKKLIIDGLKRLLEVCEICE